jgi:uncharacterized membrane protein
MKELVVLGFASRELAEEARSRGAELDREGVLQLDGAALAYRRDDGRVELVQPMRLAPVGAASGAAAGGVLGLLLLEPVLFAAVGAAAGAAGAGLSALGLNQWFLRQLDETLEPGRAALFVVVSDADPERAIQALRPLAPRCCAPPCPPTPSGASSPPSPTPLPRRARRRPPHQLQTDRPGGAGLLWSKARSWRSGEGSLAGRPQVGRRAAEQPHQVGDRDIQPPGAARPRSPSS